MNKWRVLITILIIFESFYNNILPTQGVLDQNLNVLTNKSEIFLLLVVSNFFALWKQFTIFYFYINFLRFIKKIQILLPQIPKLFRYSDVTISVFRDLL